MYAIFTGEVNNLTNLVVQIRDNTLRVVSAENSYRWRFNLERGEFEAVAWSGTDWATQIIEMSGREMNYGPTYIASEVTMNMVDYKLSPAV